MIPGEYVLPLRWTDDVGLDELVAYLDELVRWIPVTVVDGSASAIFDRHSRALPSEVVHVAPEPWAGGNGKVAGVMTGLRRASADRVVVADDDVRYTEESLRRVVDLLEHAEVVRPANYFDPRPWHARWDTSRSLLNRALGSDYPGTLAVRRSLLLAAGGYAGDVLFENLELLRTVRAAGGREWRADDVLVRRLPPSAKHFVSQRVRQAYDDLAQPPRLFAELSILPLVVLGCALRRPRVLLVGLGALVTLAELGRRRGGGARVFPVTSALWLPLWLGERGICVWLALVARLRGGVRYSGGRLLRAATPRRELRRRVAVALSTGGGLGPRRVREADASDATPPRREGPQPRSAAEAAVGEQT
jgi:Glycosyltransferase like family 2